MYYLVQELIKVELILIDRFKSIRSPLWASFVPKPILNYLKLYPKPLSNRGGIITP